MSQEQLLQEAERVITGEVIRPIEYPPEPRNYAESVERLQVTGLEQVLGLIEDGHSQREICKRIGTRPAHLNRWLSSMPEAATRAHDARLRGAQAWLDRGLAAIEDAHSVMDLAKARELAQICRRYAAIYNPAFSDRVQVDTTVKSEDPAAIDAKLRSLVQQVTEQVRPKGDE
jgi:hypothetical protein